MRSPGGRCCSDFSFQHKTGGLVPVSLLTQKCVCAQFIGLKSAISTTSSMIFEIVILTPCITGKMLPYVRISTAQVLKKFNL